jgi:hypothetical protein
MGIAESFNRTLKRMLNKYMTANNTATWINVLQEIVNNYNNTIYSTIQKKSVDVSLFEQAQIVANNRRHNEIVKDYLHNRYDIKEGDSVRLPVAKKTFQKEGKKFTDEIYKVEKLNAKSLLVEGSQKRYAIDKVLKVKDDAQKIDASQFKEAKHNARSLRFLRRQGLKY